MECIFILDGAPPCKTFCAVETCANTATGSYEVCAAETGEILGITVPLCEEHGKLLATGTSAGERLRPEGPEKRAT